MAVGVSPLIPSLPGVDNAVTAFDVLTGKVDVGESVVVIGGGGVGCDTAAKLAEDGKRVTIVEMLPKIGADIGISTRWDFGTKFADTLFKHFYSSMLWLKFAYL